MIITKQLADQCAVLLNPDVKYAINLLLDDQIERLKKKIAETDGTIDEIRVLQGRIRALDELKRYDEYLKIGANGR